MEKESLLREWVGVKEQLEDLKIREMELRKEVVNEFFPHNEADLLQGTHYTLLGNGFKLKAVFKVNRSLSKDSAALNRVASQLLTFGYNWEKIIDFEPKLNTREYKKVAPEIRRCIDQVVTAKPGATSLEIVAGDNHD